jgi:tetrahydromethanopterin S-methyltransferase subunit F
MVVANGQKRLARLPTRRELAGIARGIIFAAMMLTTLRLLFFLR